MNRVWCGIDFAHLFRMTDSTGLYQHAKYSIPDRAHGYTVDDNARALIVACEMYRLTEDTEFLELIYIYLGYMWYSRDGHGSMYNFMDYAGNPILQGPIGDSIGRTVWSLGVVAGYKELLPAGMYLMVDALLEELVGSVMKSKSLRNTAYALLGLSKIKEQKANTWELAEKIVRLYKLCAVDGWDWFETTITYGNFVLPWALFEAHAATGNKEYLEIAEKSFAFLLEQCTIDGVFSPIGCNGWSVKDWGRALYDQQPLEAAGGVMTALAGYRLTNKPIYMEAAMLCDAWFHGSNSKKQDMIDHVSGGCFDGIMADGPNLNQGAESLLSYLLSTISLNEGKVVSECTDL